MYRKWFANAANSEQALPNKLDSNPNQNDKMMPRINVGLSVQNFADYTSMHGINELYHAKTRFWMMFWFIIILTAFGITGFQVYRALQQYVDQATVTVITPAQADQILYPPVQLCYLHWMYWVDWQKAKSLNFTKPAILYALSFITDGFSSSHFDVEKAKMEFLTTFHQLNMTTLSKFYSAISLDLNIVGGNVNGTLFQERQLTFKYPNPMYCYRMQAQTLYKFLKDQEKEPTAYSNGLDLWMSLGHRSYANFADFMTREEYNHHVAFYLMNNYEYSANVEVFRDNFTDSVLPPFLYPNAYDAYETRLIPQNEKYFITFVVTAHRWKTSVIDKPCTVGQRSVLPDDICFRECHINYFAERCKCLFLDNAVYLGTDFPQTLCPEAIHFLPLFNNNSYSKSINETDDDRLERLFNSRNQNCDVEYPGWKDNDKICIKQCIPACETWSYDLHVSTTAALKFGNRLTSAKNITTVWIKYPITGDILVLTETDPRTWEDFVGNVGGLLGIWTGASIISFIQMIYLCCCAESEFNCRGTNTNNKTRVIDTQSKTKMRNMIRLRNEQRLKLQS